MSGLALKGLYLEELQDLYDAENRPVRALPKMTKVAKSAELGQCFESKLEQTEQHAVRLEQIFERINEEPKRKKSAAMVGLIREEHDLMDKDYEDGVKDVALISAPQRVKHYEMAAYDFLKTWAGILVDFEAQALLEQTLSEEKETDQRLVAPALDGTESTPTCLP